MSEASLSVGGGIGFSIGGGLTSMKITRPLWLRMSAVAAFTHAGISFDLMTSCKELPHCTSTGSTPILIWFSGLGIPWAATPLIE